MSGYRKKKSETAKENRTLHARKSNYSQSINSVDRILFLQRTIGNQAFGRLLKSGALQAKLRIGQPDDIYEQEAYRVDGQVMRMPEPTVSEKNNCDGECTNIQRKCPKLEEYEKMHRKPLENILKAQRSSTPTVAPELEEDVNSINGKGQPLTESLRSFFEPRFGYDFSHVRLHTNNVPDRLSRSMNAMAFTVGNNIVFSSGAYNPASNDGLHLLGHELTHTVQQTGGVQTKRFSQQLVAQKKCSACETDELQRSLDISISRLIQRRVVCDEWGEKCQSVPDEEETTLTQPEVATTSEPEQNYTPYKPTTSEPEAFTYPEPKCKTISYEGVISESFLGYYPDLRPQGYMFVGHFRDLDEWLRISKSKCYITYVQPRKKEPSVDEPREQEPPEEPVFKGCNQEMIDGCAETSDNREECDACCDNVFQDLTCNINCKSGCMIKFD